MPKLMTTRTRIEDLGKPRIMIMDCGFDGTVLSNTYRYYCFQTLSYPVAASNTQGLLISSIGFRNKFFVLLSWLWSYFSYDKSNRLIIDRPRDGVQ